MILISKLLLFSETFLSHVNILYNSVKMERTSLLGWFGKLLSIRQTPGLEIR